MRKNRSFLGRVLRSWSEIMKFKLSMNAFRKSLLFMIAIFSSFDKTNSCRMLQTLINRDFRLFFILHLLTMSSAIFKWITKSGLPNIYETMLVWLPIGSMPICPILIGGIPIGDIPIGPILIGGIPIGPILTGDIPTGGIPNGRIPKDIPFYDCTVLSIIFIQNSATLTNCSTGMLLKVFQFSYTKIGLLFLACRKSKYIF